jgi:hypothetical protein
MVRKHLASLLTFSDTFDHNFERWHCTIVEAPTKATAVQVYEMIRNSTFQELFGGFGATLDSLTLAQA